MHLFRMDLTLNKIHIYFFINVNIGLARHIQTHVEGWLVHLQVDFIRETNRPSLDRYNWVSYTSHPALDKDVNHKRQWRFGIMIL